MFREALGSTEKASDRLDPAWIAPGEARIGAASRWRLREWLLLLTVSIALPLTALLAYTSYTEYRDRFQLVGESVQSVAGIAARDAASFIADARAALAELAGRPQVRALDSQRCDPILKDIPRLFQRLANILVVDRTGALVCTVVAQPAGRPRSAANTEWFKRVMRKQDFVIGPPAVGFITGRWVITMAYPVRDDGGAVIGAIGMPVDLFRYGPVAQLSADRVAMLLNSEGTVVARAPEPEKWVGRNLRGTGITDAVLARRRGYVEAVSAAGVLHVAGFEPVPGSDWYAVAQVSASAVYAPVYERAMWDLALALLALIAACTLAFVLGRRILVPVKGVAATAVRIAAGDFAARTTPAGPAEIAVVAGQFNHMLDVVLERDAALRDREELLRQLTMAARDGIVMVDDAGKIVFWNEAAAQMFGWSREEALGQPVHTLVVPARFREKAGVGVQRFAGTGEGAIFSKTIELVGLRKDGTEFVTEHSFAAVRIAGRWHAIAVVRDISERKAAQAQLERQLDELRRFQKVAIGRELRIKEVKEENARLGERLAAIEKR